MSDGSSASVGRPGYLRGAACLAKDILPGKATIVEVHGVEVGLFRVDDAIYAIRNYCPHRGAPVCRGKLSGTMMPWKPGELVLGLEGRVLHCPWHHWEFDITTGKSVFGVDKSRLITYQVETYEVEEVGEEVCVWVKPPRASAANAADNDRRHG